MPVFWSKKYTQLSILFSTGLLVFHLMLFPEYSMPLPILLVGYSIIIFFFVALQQYSYQWQRVHNFKKKIFYHSLFYRTLGVIGMYLLTYFYNPENLPFEIFAIDSVNYHTSGMLVAEAIQGDRSIFKVLDGFWKGESDFGFSILIGWIYYFIGPYPLWIKILNILAGSLTVVRVYQIARFVLDESKARVAAIITMLMPAFLWFGGMVLKETILILLIVNVGYLVMQAIRSSRFQWIAYLLILLQCAVMFYFRTFLPLLIFICLLLQVLFLKTSRKAYRVASIVIAFLLIIGGNTVIETLGMKESVYNIIESSTTRFENELSTAAADRGVSYETAVIAPLLLAGAIITPFPSLLDFEKRQLNIFTHFQNEIIRNILYFFVFLGLLRIFRKRTKGIVFIASFAIGYIVVLAASGISFQDRFQLLALPFLIIFMADGISISYPSKLKHWKLYLIFICIAVVLWNVFKLSNRGLL